MFPELYNIVDLLQVDNSGVLSFLEGDRRTEMEMDRDQDGIVNGGTGGQMWDGASEEMVRADSEAVQGDAEAHCGAY